MKKKLSDYSNDKTLVAASILAADFARLGEELRDIESAGADIIHVDVMDGHFVPNISIGPPVVSSIREYSSLPFDVHLMIKNPLKYARAFAEAGADHITFHVEADDDPDEVFSEILSLGCSAGICLRPRTAAEEIFHWLDRTAMVLVMSVEPGFGGQKFMPEALPKIRAIKDYIRMSNLRTHIEVDGGIDSATAKEALRAGANVMVAGTSIYRSSLGYAKAVAAIRDAG